MNITTVLLAGGLSKRMGGNDKAFLKLGNKTFIRIILETVSSVSNQIIISTNKDKEIYKEAIKNINSKIIFVKDIEKYKGPLNAVVSCEPYIENDTVFLTSCDTPFLKKEVISLLAKKLNGYDCLIPSINGRHQSLNTVYTKKSFKIAKNVYFEEKKDALFSWIDKLNKKIIYEEEIKGFDKNLLSYLSINTPELYKKALDIFYSVQ